MFFVVILASIALFLSTVAVQRNREQDKERLVAEQNRILTQQILACEQFNRARRTDYESNRALVSIVVANSRDPSVIPPVVLQFLQYNEDANEPVSCDPKDPNFMVDTTPASVPPLPEIPL